MSSPGTISNAGRRVGEAAARAAVADAPKSVTPPPPPLSRISERTNESASVVMTSPPGQTPPQPLTPERMRDIAQRALQNKLVVACIVFVLTFALLVAINPPMAQDPNPSNPAAPPVRSFRKMAVWSLLSATIALVLPFGAKYFVKTSN